ncbi:hypothetical protein ACS0TY_007653 [Phlomoides rotata]
MGFQSVYSSLLDLFPQVDPRALKAVAIEHSKDVDTAVIAVLEEIIPFLTEKPTPSSPLSQSFSISESSNVDTQKEDCPLVETGGLVQLPNAYIVDSGKQTTLGDADDGPNEPFYEACARHHEGEVNNIAELTLSEKNHDNKMEMSFDMHYCAKPFMLKLGTRKVRSGFIIKKTFGETQSLETVSGDECLESSIKVSSDDVPLHIFETSQVDSSVSEEMNLLQDKEDVAGHSETDFGTACNVESHPESSFADVKDLVNETALLTVDEVTVQPSEGSAVEVPSMQESNLDNSNACLSADSASIPENMSNIVGTEYESNLNATMSQSSQIHTMDVIEEIIADARNNKKTLFSAMEYVINLMMQVEDKEKAAQQAKVEAASGGMDIMNKVQELKQMLEYAKKGNNMDAGDVYGEKAILATELRELQSRVLSLSDERDKSLAVLDEMRQTLEVQLAAAENEIRSAEQEKLEKENAARKLFADQELVMEKVVQESKNLKQLAEENANVATLSTWFLLSITCELNN